jgi:ATP-dependent exoDNAse (exonuclease V) alpha subunit
MYDFTKKQSIIHSEIILPDHAPIEFYDRQTLWNAVEKSEKQSNARTAREIVVTLPNELTAEQNVSLVRDYVRENFINKGMCADFSVHAGHINLRKGEKYPFEGLTVQQENPHAHILLTVRPINTDGSWGAKSKKITFSTKTARKSS